MVKINTNILIIIININLLAPTVKRQNHETGMFEI